jgi:hypothetical protein
MNPGSVDPWLTWKICERELSTMARARTARAAGAEAEAETETEAETVRKPPALLRGDREHEQAWRIGTLRVTCARHKPGLDG